MDEKTTKTDKNPVAANEPAKQPATSDANSNSVPAKWQLDLLLRQKFATAIAKKREKWANAEQELMLAAILQSAGVERDKIPGIISACGWHGCVLNGSQFSQWADGKKSTLTLGFKLRKESEEVVSDILDSLDAITK